MNLILVDAGEIMPEGRVILSGRRAAHITGVLGARVGDHLRVGVVNGRLGSGLVIAVADGRVELAVELREDPPPGSGIDLILALPRPIMLKRILSQVAAMGVGHLYLVNANRVEKSFFSASLLRDGNYPVFLRHGLEQAVATRMPEVSVQHRFRPFIEDELPGRRGQYDHLLLAHPGAAASLAGIFGSGAGGRVLLAVGPEGGWVDFEVDRFREAGFLPFTMGTRILRVDTAVVALLAQLGLLRELGRK